MGQILALALEWMEMAKAPMKLLLGFTLGTVALLMWSWLEDTWLAITGTPHVCDAGSPAEEACPHGVRDADNCLMCAIEKPDDNDPTPLLKAIERNEWVNSIERWLEMQKGKK
jgi:hypothetical protein